MSTRMLPSVVAIQVVAIPHVYLLGDGDRGGCKQTVSAANLSSSSPHVAAAAFPCSCCGPLCY